MRFREPFSLYPRKSADGKLIYYYRTYTEKGDRTIGRSTGQTSKSGARKVCLELWKKNKLIPEKIVPTIPILSDFGTLVWDYEKSPMIKYRRLRDFNMSKSHVENQAKLFKKHIIPAFGSKRLDQITHAMVDNWFLGQKEAGYSNQSINHMLSNIRTVFAEAQRQGLVAQNPAESVKPVAKASKKRGILTNEEVKEILHPENWSSRWPSWYVYLANLTAALTGLRMGEIQALRWQDLFPENKPDRINVSCSWDRRHGLKETKTKKDRVVPLPAQLKQLIFKFAVSRPSEAFIFSTDRGETPINEYTLLHSFYEALEKCGITEAERKERNLTFHGWRHFFNTFLRRSGVADSKVQRVTGHSTQQMTENYTHFEIEDFKEISEAQNALLDFQKPFQKTQASQEDAKSNENE